jgi:hypothetical protein
MAESAARFNRWEGKLTVHFPAAQNFAARIDPHVVGQGDFNSDGSPGTAAARATRFGAIPGSASADITHASQASCSACNGLV